MAGGEDTEYLRLKLAHLPGPSRGGLPLSENRCPAEDIAPWVARLVSAKAYNDPEITIDCGMCTDMAYTRFIFSGGWTADAANGFGSYKNEVLQFGQLSKFMKLTCKGDVMSAGFGLVAGGLYALTGRTAKESIDFVEQDDIFGLYDDEIRETLNEECTPSQWNLAMEEALRRYIKRVDPPPPDPVSIAFELAAFRDPTQSLADFAESQNISLRKLERVVKRDFGLTPRTVMRRARALDLAALLIGVADDNEEEEIILRYFDQSHLIKDFTSFFGVTPHKFRSHPRPILMISLEQRQARRLEELKRLAPGERRPWYD